MKEGGKNSADLFAGCKGFQPNTRKRLLNHWENNGGYEAKSETHIGSLIHRTWDSKLVSFVADDWKYIKWENEEGSNETGDKYHMSFYEMVIDAEISYGI